MRWPALCLFSLLGAFFLFMVTPLWDSDSWWHLASGRWIVANLAIPDIDPFAVFGAADEVRNDTVLKGQWLGQVLLYLLSVPAGIDGLILARALILCSVLALIWLRTPPQRRGVALLLLIPAGMLSLGLTAERPQLLAYLLAALCFLVLEKRCGGRAHLVLIFLLTLLWANIHASVLLWVVLLVLAAVYAALRDLRAGTGFGADSRQHFSLAAVAAIASLLTPNGWKSWWYLFDLQGSALQQATSEYVSSLLLFRLGYYLPQLWVLLLLAAAVAALYPLWRRGRYRESLWLALLLLISIVSYRYLAFFMIIALPWVASVLPVPRLSAGQGRLLSASVPVLALLAIGLGLYSGRVPGFGVDERLFPVQAVQVMQARGLRGKVFSAMRWGGYMLWQTYPALTPWTDGRMLDMQRFPPYTHMLWATPQGIPLFAAEQFDYVLLPERNRFGGEVYGLHGYLRQQGWVLLYRDEGGVMLWGRS